MTNELEIQTELPPGWAAMSEDERAALLKDIQKVIDALMPLIGTMVQVSIFAELAKRTQKEKNGKPADPAS